MRTETMTFSLKCKPFCLYYQKRGNNFSTGVNVKNQVLYRTDC